MRRFICWVAGHRVARFAARKSGRHMAGSMCVRCGRVTEIKPGSRQERRRIMRERLASR